MTEQRATSHYNALKATKYRGRPSYAERRRVGRRISAENDSFLEFGIDDLRCDWQRQRVSSNTLVACECMLSLFRWDFADVTGGNDVVFKFHHYDVRKDVSAVADVVAIRNVKNLLNTEIIPHVVLELNEV